jgi:hypothetical protein
MLTKALTVKMAAVTTAATLGIGPAGGPVPPPVEATTNAESALLGQAPGGNLIVVVPVTPSRSALRGLCSALLVGGDDVGDTTARRRPTSPDRQADANTIRALIAATGGSVASATAWCRRYLHVKPSSRPR